MLQVSTELLHPAITAMAQDQMKINVSRIVSVVKPVIPTVRHRMFLSNLDLRWISFKNTQNLLFYKTKNRDQEFCTTVETLKRSLSSVLVDFYPFAGRLDIQGGESGRPEVDCNDEGVGFIEASIDITFEDVEKDEFQHKSFFNQLVRTHDQNSYDTPLLSIQITAFLEGGICIGTNLHHALADATSFWYFMTCWAELSRGLPISKKPVHMRTVFKRDKKNNVIPKISFKAEEVITDRVKGAQVLKFLPENLLPMHQSESPVAQKGLINVSTSAVAVKNAESNNSIQKSMQKDETEVLDISTFHFSEHMIRNLKERAQSSSSFVGVAAHFWRCVIEARNVPENQPVSFLMLADWRDRLKPPLPPTYVGNCLCPGVARTTAKQLLEQDICFAAGLIQELIKSCTTEAQFNNHIDWIESRDLDSFRLVDSDYYLVVVNSPRFKVYDIDYGWGKPLNVQTGSINIGGMVLFIGRHGGKSIDVSTSLPRHQMQTLKRILLTDVQSCRL